MEKLHNKTHTHKGEEDDQEQAKLSLLEALSPATARIFKELQNLSLSHDDFMKRIGEYNELRQKHNPKEKGALTTCLVDISSTRQIRVDFSRVGYVALTGTDYSS